MEKRKNLLQMKQIGLSVRKKVALMLIELRKQRNLSQQALAKMVNTTQAVISRIENMNATPTLELLERIVKACGKELSISIDSKKNLKIGTAHK
jgi:transcriptional regulator with XRE-family HTH domain